MSEYTRNLSETHPPLPDRKPEICLPVQKKQMRKITTFNFITLDGFYKGANEDISWHKHGGGEDENEFSAKSAGAGNTLLFGRVTYQMMASWWPTPMAMQQMPAIAKGMNDSEKIVFSKTLANADWSNTRIIKDDIIETVKKMKQEPGNDMTILGSGSIIAQFAAHGLIDEYTIMLDPLAIGEGTSLFKGMKHQLDLELTNTRTFKSGRLLLSYRAIKK